MLEWRLVWNGMEVGLEWNEVGLEWNGMEWRLSGNGEWHDSLRINFSHHTLVLR